MSPTPPGQIDLKEMIELVETLYEMEGASQVQIFNTLIIHNWNTQWQTNGRKHKWEYFAQLKHKKAYNRVATLHEMEGVSQVKFLKKSYKIFVYNWNTRGQTTELQTVI